METLILITLYVANVFLNRYLNKVAYKLGSDKVWIIWFVPVFTTIVLLFGIVVIKCYRINNTFTGKYWKNNKTN